MRKKGEKPNLADQEAGIPLPTSIPKDMLKDNPKIIKPNERIQII